MIRLLPESILDQTRLSPGAPAVRSRDGVVTYAELSASAHRIAGALAARGIHAESTVAVLIPPGPDLVAALLGIWLAGGCYVPLDPLAPPRRLREVLDLAGARILLTGETGAPVELILPPGATRHTVGDLTRASDSQSFQYRSVDPQQAAYMIFTSGSTGTPKGVVIEHAGIANLVHWGVRRLALTPEDRVLQKTPLTFDAAGWEIFAPLACGAPVTFGRPDAGRDAGELIRSIQESGATVLQVVPTMFRLLSLKAGLRSCTSLRLICSGGEQLDAELCQRVLEHVDVEILNTYGPSEFSINALAAQFDPAQRSGPVPIGHPIDNTRYLLFPPEAGLTPDEAVRELYLCGVGVARGYHGDAAQTAQRFLPDAGGPPGTRMYRTGDLVRTRSDGALEFVGRVDAQVKINGIRVELGEIEAALLARAGVVEAAVRAMPDPRGVTRLAAWVVTAGDDTIAGIDAHLRERLSLGLVPAVISELPGLPRTTSGKIDRSRLPEPDWSAAAPDREAVAPGTAEEHMVLAAWQRVLGIDRIGLDDDFFRLGGHSLLMTRLAAELGEASGLVLEFRELLYSTTPRAQATLLGKAVQAAPIEPLAPGSRLPLSPAQERFWLLDRMDPGSREYLVPVLVWLPVDVPEETVGRALAAIMAHHDVLRTRYVMDADGLAAVVEPAPAVPLRTVETAPAEAGKAVAEALAEGFDLGAAPLFRATLVRDGAEEQLLLLVCHHIICDGWSTRLLARDIREMIDALGSGRMPDFSEPSVRYADAVAWLRSRLTPELLTEQLDYWRAELSGLPVLDLPTIRTRDPVRSIEGASVGVGIPAEAATDLLAVGRRTGASPYVVFLTLWTILLARTGGRWDFGVGSPHAGRSRPELYGLVGTFIDVVVIRARLTPDMSFVEALTRVERACREGFARHTVPFEVVVDELVRQRDPSRTPLFQTLFTLAEEGLTGHDQRERDLELLAEAWRVARTDMALTVWRDSSGRYRGVIEYASTIFEETAAIGLANRLGALAARFAADPDLPVGAAGLDEAQHGGTAPPESTTLPETILGFLRDLLPPQEIGLDDDIMQRGGTSLLAARLLWNVQTTFGVEMSMRAFFDRPTAAGVAAEVERLVRAELDDGPQDGPASQGTERKDA